MPAKKPRKRKLNKEEILAYFEGKTEGAREASNYLLKHLLNTATEDDFLQIKYLDIKKTKSIIIKGGKEISEDEKQNYVSEARTIIKLRLFKDIMESMKWTANERIFNNSQKDADIVYGKAMLYTLDVLQKKLDNLSSLTD